MQLSDSTALPCRALSRVRIHADCGGSPLTRASSSFAGPVLPYDVHVGPLQSGHLAHHLGSGSTFASRPLAPANKFRAPLNGDGGTVCLCRRLVVSSHSVSRACRATQRRERQRLSLWPIDDAPPVGMARNAPGKTAMQSTTIEGHEASRSTLAAGKRARRLGRALECGERRQVVALK